MHWPGILFSKAFFRVVLVTINQLGFMVEGTTKGGNAEQADHEEQSGCRLRYRGDFLLRSQFVATVDKGGHDIPVPKISSPFQSPSSQPAFSPVSYLPAVKTCVKSLLLNSPFRLASPK